MYDLLHSNDCWENPPTPLVQVDQNADDENQDEEVACDRVAVELLHEASSSQDSEDVALGISSLLKVDMITRQQSESLSSLYRLTFKQQPSSTVTFFEKPDKKTQSRRKYCLFLKIQ